MSVTDPPRFTRVDIRQLLAGGDHRMHLVPGRLALVGVSDSQQVGLTEWAPVELHADGFAPGVESDWHAERWHPDDVGEEVVVHESRGRGRTGSGQVDV